MSRFRELIEKKTLLCDGPMGTMLQASVLKEGQCPELLNIEKPDDVIAVHKAYINAGADILETNTFGANRVKLSAYGLENQTKKITEILGIDKEGNILPPKPPPVPTGIKCYKCKSGELVVRQSKKGPFLGCNKFPRCRTIISMEQLDNLKQLQADGKWPPGTWEEADQLLGRKKAKKTKKVKKAKKAKKSKKVKKAV